MADQVQDEGKMTYRMDTVLITALKYLITQILKGDNYEKVCNNIGNWLSINV
jgi:hypothetical protein